MTLRALLKAAVEGTLGSRPARAAGRARLRGARLVLAYHNVVAGERTPARGDASLHLPLARFRAQLEAIGEAGLAVVSVDAPAPAADATPQVAITFDDAYASALALAVPELAARRFPATVFVAPGLVGNAAPWWDRLADESLGGIADERRDAALMELGGDGEQILAAARARGWPLQPAVAEHRIGQEREIANALASHTGLSLGAHTWSHPNVARLPAERLEHELTAPLAWLRARWSDRVIPWLAYPYGLESPAARAAAARLGYSGAFLVAGGWHRAGGDAFAIPRFNVTPGLSTAGFRARLGGFL